MSLPIEAHQQANLHSRAADCPVSLNSEIGDKTNTCFQKLNLTTKKTHGAHEGDRLVAEVLIMHILTAVIQSAETWSHRVG